MFKICGFELEPGTKKQVILGVDMGDLTHVGKVTNIPENVEVAQGTNNYEMPATLICGKKPGKTALFTAGIHAGEFPGVAAVVHAAKEIDPMEVSGNIILIHNVNVSGFNMRTNGLVYEDDANLNGNYPGDENGTQGERIAAYFVKNIFPYIDFCCDFHSGGNGEFMYPLLFYPINCKSEEASYKAALAVDIPHIVISKAEKGEVHWAARQFDVPGFIIETGHSSLACKEWIDLDMRNIFLILDHLGIYHKAELNPQMICKKIVCGDNDYLGGEADGMWVSMVEANQWFKKGEILGRIEDFYGNTLYTYTAKKDGLVLYLNSGIYAKPGFDMMALAYTDGIKEI